MRIAKPLATCLVLAASPLLARTVALWPLNWNAGNNRPDGGNAVSDLGALGNLSVNSEATFVQDSTAIGWSLPPNPEERNCRFPPTRTDAGYASSAGNAKWLLASAALVSYVAVTNDFTLEGWIRIPALPTNNDFFFVASGDGSNSSSTSQRWFLTFRNNGNMTGVTWQIFSQRENTGDALLVRLSNEQIHTLTNGWHHIAISHRMRASDAIWQFYQDGELLGSKTADKCTGTVVPAGGLLSLGGRNQENTRIVKGSFSYWRLSDKALEPEAFLNAATRRTAALWKLDRDARGGLDGTPSIGTAHLTGAFVSFHTNEASSVYATSTFYPDSDCAFANTPPNSTVVLPTGNTGSLYSRQYSGKSRLAIPRVGVELSLTNDFTVEGWLKLECRDFEYANVRNAYANRHLFGTRSGWIGWLLQMGKSRGDRKLRLFAQDILNVSGNVLPETEVGDISAYEGQWIHVAVTYDHDGGDGATGVWNCYVNGSLTGAATNSVTPSDGAVDANRSLILGPQKADSSMFSPAVKYDCWRVARTVLQPSQFMCATNGTAATDVLALWPINAQNGIYIDGTDVAGSYTFEDPLTGTYMASAADGAPEVAGISTADNGSARFRSGNDGSKSYLVCNDADVAATISNAGDYTFETYLYRTEQPIGYEFILLSSKGNLNPVDGNSIGDLYMNLTYRSYGFQMYDRGVFNGDRKFVDEDGQDIMLPLNKWTHLALTYRIESGTCIFDLYLDGQKRGTVSHADSGITKYTPAALFLGGRYTSETSWRGKMSTVRISKGCLSSNEFLCARSARPESLAYWPLDGVPALDLTGRILIDDGSFGGALNSFTAWSDVTGLSGALSRVPRPDTSTNFVGNASANAGAVQLAAGGYAQGNETGTYVDLDGSFTAEGWIRWARSQGAAVETVCGTYAGGKGGWKLVLDSTGGTPEMRIHAEGEGPVCVLADGVLMADASSLEGTWHHLALRYDAAAGDGVWSLLVDGVAAGSVTNVWRPSGIFDRAEFRLGAFGGDTSFAGGYDMWRISRGVRGADDILWMPPKGTLMIFR